MPNGWHVQSFANPDRRRPGISARSDGWGWLQSGVEALSRRLRQVPSNLVQAWLRRACRQDIYRGFPLLYRMRLQLYPDETRRDETEPDINTEMTPRKQNA